jgi:antirestriction protein ArdC
VKSDIYQRVTDQIVASLETGIRPWMKPWSGEHAAGRITRPLRGNGIPYQGINVLMLWGAAIEKGYSAPIWMNDPGSLADVVPRPGYSASRAWAHTAPRHLSTGA